MHHDGYGHSGDTIWESLIKSGDVEAMKAYVRDLAIELFGIDAYQLVVIEPELGDSSGEVILKLRGPKDMVARFADEFNRRRS